MYVMLVSAKMYQSDRRRLETNRNSKSTSKVSAGAIRAAGSRQQAEVSSDQSRMTSLLFVLNRHQSPHSKARYETPHSFRTHKRHQARVFLVGGNVVAKVDEFAFSTYVVAKVDKFAYST